MSTSTSDLAGALWSIGLYLLIVAAIVGVVVLIARWRRSTTVLIDSALAISAVWVALFVIATPFAIAQTLTGGTVWVDDLPVSVPWNEGVACGSTRVSDATTYLECASVGEVNASIVGLPFGTRALLATGQFIGALLIATPAAAIGVICFQLLRGAAFARVTSRTLLVTAIVILVGGIAGDLATGVGRGLAALEVFPSSADPDATGAVATYNLTVQMWPFGAALALAALAAVFRYGARLERDTAGLV
ncbi:hypothetical protein [Microbacterium sp. SLBN-146]|uniref:hypothetical protein n=1 Tax=Microbacterium sp. SLBN-146 TaxID=2768457 RepID=UPI001152DD6D|nr:hypothetical protein [Microbacterium sp. SLBN-146]TQJ30659.1 hypothetical protein FBY39_1115 [Microbacterium sp. SLBN-146]